MVAFDPCHGSAGPAFAPDESSRQDGGHQQCIRPAAAATELAEASHKEAAVTAKDPGASPRTQDVVGAVSRRTVLQSDSDDDDAGTSEPRRHMFRLVDFEPPARLGLAPSATTSGKQKRRGSRGAKRWCAKEFDTESGWYTCSTDGMCEQLASACTVGA